MAIFAIHGILPKILLKNHPAGHSLYRACATCAMAQLRLVSLPDVVQSMVGKDASQALKNFDRHYMPDGHPNADAFARFSSEVALSFALQVRTT